MRWWIFFLLVFPGLSTVYLNYPINLTLSDGDEVYLGKIAPNENFTVIFSKQSDIVQTCAGKVVCGPNESKNPIVWNWNAFKIGEAPDDIVIERDFPSLYIRIPEDVSPGEKNITLSFHVCSNPEFVDTNCHDITYPQRITLRFLVDRNPYDVAVDKRVYPAGETTYIVINISSYSLGSNSFFVSEVSGLPRKWIGVSNRLVLGSKETGKIYVPLTPKEEGLYNVKITVVRGDGYVYNINESIRIVPTLFSKLSVFNEGVAVVPPILQPFYSFFGIFA